MRRILTAVIGAVALSLALVGAASADTTTNTTPPPPPPPVTDCSSCHGFNFAGPATAVTPDCVEPNCAGWTIATESYREQYLSCGGVRCVKLVVYVEEYRPFNTSGDQSVTDVRARCSVRKITSAITGVSVTRCALGFDGGAGINSDPNVPRLDGGTCCANAVGPVTAVHYCSFCNAFRVRGNFNLRESGTLFPEELLSYATDRAFALG